MRRCAGIYWDEVVDQIPCKRLERGETEAEEGWPGGATVKTRWLVR